MGTDGPVEVLEMFFFPRFSFSLVIIMWAGKLVMRFRAKVLGQSQEFPRDLISSYFTFVSDEQMNEDVD